MESELTVKGLLKNYGLNKALLNLTSEKNVKLRPLREAVTALNKCIAALDEEDRRLVEDLYFKKGSLRSVAELRSYSKSSIERHKNKVIERLEELFAIASDGDSDDKID